MSIPFEGAILYRNAGAAVVPLAQDWTFGGENGSAMPQIVRDEWD
jgi:hypothetical protein